LNIPDDGTGYFGSPLIARNPYSMKTVNQKETFAFRLLDDWASYSTFVPAVRPQNPTLQSKDVHPAGAQLVLKASHDL
jgi:hypothetical protein